jgi:hypothetical protein
MDLQTRIGDVQRRCIEHGDALMTEEAAKTALVMPFIQALGYDVFNPLEVVPEFTADIGTKKGEKVDYAICRDGDVAILIECKPSSVDLSLNHAGQLYRYFSVTNAHVAILTNGKIYKFYSDIDQPNRMDSEPFFEFDLGTVKPRDIRLLERFTRVGFDIDAIVQEAGSLKMLRLVRQELLNEFENPSSEFVALIAKRVHGGRMTSGLKENVSKHIIEAFNGIVRDNVSLRLSSALQATSDEGRGSETDAEDSEIFTTEEEMAGFRIVQAIAAKMVSPNRIVLRDSKSYAAILLDDNNRKTIARLHFNGMSVKYFGTFTAKEETRQSITALEDIYGFADQIESRIAELLS